MCVHNCGRGMYVTDQDRVYLCLMMHVKCFGSSYYMCSTCQCVNGAANWTELKACVSCVCDSISVKAPLY